MRPPDSVLNPYKVGGEIQPWTITAAAAGGSWSAADESKRWTALSLQSPAAAAKN